ncbi:MAG: GMC oxidoreductase [Planctomycetota bacterium]
MKSFDAIVVGLGAAGCHVVRVLAAKGLRIAAVEAGGLLGSRDLPKRAAPMSNWRRALAWRHPVQSKSISFHPALAHLYVDDRDHPYRTRGGDRFLWIRGQQVGGRLHTWARMSLRLAPRDFVRAREDGHGIAWPIGYADLAPYYDQVERHHGLSGGNDEIAELPDGQVSVRRELSPRAREFAERVRQRFPERRVIAPRVLASGTGPMPSPLEEALARGTVEMMVDSPVARIVLDDAGDRALGVERVNADGSRELVRGELVFLCASTIESLRILLASRHPRHPTGIGNGRDLLGRFVLDHNFVVAAGSVGAGYRSLGGPGTERDVDTLDLGSKLDFYVPDFVTPGGSCDFVRGFGVQGTIGATSWGMGCFGEMLPSADNRVTLSSRVDVHGLSVPNIAVRRSANDKRMIAAQKRTLFELAGAADLRIEMPLPSLVRSILWRAVGPEVGVMHIGLAIHECGGARMGSHPGESVLDPNQRVWGLPSVIVADGAALPSTGCQNPTLTIMALATRAATLAVS